MPKAIKITDENRRLVRALAAVGARHEDIAARLGISADSLTLHYRSELDEGRVDANAKVAQSLYQQALNGNVTAQIFWLKTRAQWRETTYHEVSGEVAHRHFVAEIPAPVTIDQWVPQIESLSGDPSPVPRLDS